MLPRASASRLKNALPEGTLVVVGSLVILGLSAWGFLAISARVLGPEKYAALSVLWALVFLAGPGLFLPLEQEVGRALASRRARGEGGAPVVGRVALLGAAVLGAATVAGFSFGRRGLDRLLDGQGLLVISLGVALAGYFSQHVVRGVLAGHGRFRAYSLIVGAEGTFKLLGCAALVLVGLTDAGPFGLVLGISPLLAAGVGLIGQRGLFSPGPPAPWSEVSRALGYLLAGSVLAQFLLNAGPIAVKLLASPGQQTAAGRFLAGLVVARIPLFFFAAIQAALLPKLSSLVARNTAEFSGAVRRFLGIVSAYGMVTTLGAYLVGPWTLQLMFGAEFALTRGDLALLAAASAFYMVAVSAAQASIALGGHKRVAFGWLLAGIAFVVASLPAGELFFRIEIAYLCGSVVAALVLLGFASPLLKAGRPIPEKEELVEAVYHSAIEP